MVEFTKVGKDMKFAGQLLLKFSNVGVANVVPLIRKKKGVSSHPSLILKCVNENVKA